MWVDLVNAAHRNRESQDHRGGNGEDNKWVYDLRLSMFRGGPTVLFSSLCADD